MNQNNNSENLTNTIKVALLNYYRYKRQMFCATEAYSYSGVADVLAYDKNRNIYDIEIKISAGDLSKDKEKPKHMYCKESIEKEMPIYQLYCVPEYLKDKALKFINQVNNNYGLIVFNDSLYKEQKDSEEGINFLQLIKIVKNPRKIMLLNSRDSDVIINSINLRMSSELVQCRTSLLGVNTNQQIWGEIK